jgi:hypothetical protein
VLIPDDKSPACYICSSNPSLSCSRGLIFGLGKYFLVLGHLERTRALIFYEKWRGYLTSPDFPKVTTIRIRLFK